VLAFDSDEAGARAAERAFQFLEAYPLRPVVLILPEGQDPADFVRARGGEALRELAKDAVALVEYMLRRIVRRADLSTIEGQSAAVAEALPMLRRLEDPVRRSEYGHLLAELVGVTDASVSLALDRGGAAPSVEAGPAQRRASAQERVEREMLRLLARDAEVFQALAPRLEPEHFQTARNRDLFALVVEAGGDVGEFVGRSRDEKAVQALSALALEPLDGEASAAYAEDVLARLQEFALRRTGARLRQRLQKLNPTTDPTYDELFQQLIAIDGELRRLRDRGNVPA
jgi:DNA primase